MRETLGILVQALVSVVDPIHAFLWIGSAVLVRDFLVAIAVAIAGTIAYEGIWWLVLDSDRGFTIPTIVAAIGAILYTSFVWAVTRMVRRISGRTRPDKST